MLIVCQEHFHICDRVFWSTDVHVFATKPDKHDFSDNDRGNFEMRRDGDADRVSLPAITLKVPGIERGLTAITLTVPEMDGA
jgi:hypothetical protein